MRVSCVDPATGGLFLLGPGPSLQVESEYRRGAAAEPVPPGGEIPRMETRPCSLRGAGGGRIECRWDADAPLFTLPVRASELLERGAVLLFEVCQVTTVDMAATGLVANLWRPGHAGAGQTLTVAWAFLNLKGRGRGGDLGDVELQLYRPGRGGPRGGSALPVVEWWRQARRRTYPAALSVRLQTVPAVEMRGGGPGDAAPAAGGEQAERRASAGAASGASGEPPGELAQAPPALPPRAPHEQVLVPNALTASLPGSARGSTVAAFSPDGGLLAVAGADALNFSVRLFDAATLELRATLESHHDYIYSLEWSPDGRFLVSASSDFTAKVWEVPGSVAQVRGAGGTGAAGVLGAGRQHRHRHLLQHPAFVYAATVHPGGRLLATGSFDGEVRVWDAATGERVRCGSATSTAGHSRGAAANALAFDASGKRLYVADAKGAVREYAFEEAAAPTAGADAHLGSPLLELLRTCSDLADEPIISMKMVPNGKRLVLMTKRSRMCSVDLDSFTVAKIYPSPRCSTLPIRFAVSPDSRQIISGSEDGHVYLWDVETTHMHRLTHMGAGGDPVCSVTWSPSAHAVATCSFVAQRPVHVYSHDRQKPPVKLALRDATIMAQSFLPKARAAQVAHEKSTHESQELARIQDTIANIKQRVSQSYERQVFGTNRRNM